MCKKFRNGMEWSVQLNKWPPHRRSIGNPRKRCTNNLLTQYKLTLKKNEKEALTASFTHSQAETCSTEYSGRVGVSNAELRHPDCSSVIFAKLYISKSFSRGFSRNKMCNVRVEHSSITPGTNKKKHNHLESF